MSAVSIELDDKYRLESGRVYLSGVQALVRLALLQKQRDEVAGLNTAGFISGYRGSPLGGLDQNLWQARAYLERSRIHFQPGVNEDLAATAVWGSQQTNLFAGARYDGVFSMWYGKGPGVDRSGDVLRHGNAAGSSRHGGVLVVAGDDHAAKSSTLPHQTDHIFKAVMMPVLTPAGVQEYLDLGLHGWAMSRYSGCWVAFKALADTVESSASVDVDPYRLQVQLPTDFEMPLDGLNIRWPDPPLVQEKRLLNFKLYAALAYCRANRLNQVVIDSPRPRLGIISNGKSYLDVRQALDDLGIDDALAAEIGIRLYKIGMVWPLESEGVRHFAEGLEEILVVEEKRQFIEYQLKEELYNWREDVRPRVIGKFDEKGEWAFDTGASGQVWHGEWLLPAAGELTPATIARVIAARISRFHTSARIRDRLAFLDAKEQALAQPKLSLQRTPHFCAGCPHNTSTRVPEGSRAVAGIGCHYMVTWMDRSTATFTHMGGEGVTWVGQAPFTEERHIFANLGDGTYFHSGLLAIRQAVAAGVNITYKILFNDAVAMTGGQPIDGQLSVPRIARQLQAEGVGRVVVVTDGTERAYGSADLPAGVAIHARGELDAIQRQLREVKGVSALIYDQTCAAEKRRRRKRGNYPDPARRVFINTAVCEACGDCSTQSNCLAVVPVETEFGRKRGIDQSACNKDYSCLEGFCPSLVTVEGGALRRGRALVDEQLAFPPLPQPQLPASARPWGILITGVGGTGVITIGALIGMAAHIEGKGVSTLDMTGLAQKFGAVYSHVRIADRPQDIHAVRIAAGEADAVIGGDVVVTNSAEALAKMQKGVTRAVVNSTATPTAEFISNPDWQFPLQSMQQDIEQAVEEASFVDASALSASLMGNAIAANLFLLGFAWQKGLIPLTEASLHQAIELNNVAVEMNLRAFLWGRRAAHDPQAVQRIATPQSAVSLQPRPALADLLEQRGQALTRYQNRAYAERYRRLVARVEDAETGLGLSGLALAVAYSYYKLLAYKDEYEVARLFVDAAFQRELDAVFDGDYRVRLHLAPPLWARSDPATGRIRKRSYGPWILPVFHLLARLKFIRGSWLDPFARHHDRRLERDDISHYEQLVDELLSGLSPDSHATALALAELPLQLRGYGPIKNAARAAMRRKQAELLVRFRADSGAERAA